MSVSITRGGTRALSAGISASTRRQISFQSTAAAVGRQYDTPTGRIAAPILVSPPHITAGNLDTCGNYQPNIFLNTTMQQQQRYFSSRGGRGGGRGGGKFGDNKSNEPLKNEHLIRSILRNAKASGPEAVQVRLVVDKGPGNPPDTNIVSLQNAMETSNDLGVDLIEIALKHEVPVIKAIDYSRLVYEKTKKSKPTAGGQKKGGGGKKATKEFKFKAGIADNDLERKADNMIKYLLKGHPCQVTILSNRFRLRQDANAAANTLERVRSVLGDHVLEPKNTKANEAGTYTTMMFQPNPKKARKEA